MGLFKIILVCFIAVIVIWCFIYNKLLIISINRELAASRGIKTALYENIFVVVVAVVVMFSIKWIGILLINSLLILPAASARNLASDSRRYLGLSVLISLIGSIAGLLLSFYFGISAGAAIVTLLAAVFFVTYLFRRK